MFGRMDRGGAESMIMSLYRKIDRSEIQFDFVVHTKDVCHFDEEIKSLGGKIYSLPSYNGKNHLRYKREFKRFFEEHTEYKVIHGHVRSTASIYLRIAKKYGLTTIAHSHNTSSGKGLAAAVKGVLQYPIRNIADYLLACSKDAGRWLFGDNVINRDNFYVLNNAIDASNYIYNEDIRLRKRAEFNIDDKLVIGHIARFHPQKNHTFLIDVFKKVHDKDKNTVLLLVGDGDLKKSVEEKVENLGLTDHVIFTGVRSDVPEIYQALDMFVFPSHFEGLGIVTVEAQATGLKCLVSDVIPEEAYVTDLMKSISLKEPAENWAEEIIQGLNYERRNTYEEIRRNGYDIHETTEWLEDFYLNKIYNTVNA